MTTLNQNFTMYSGDTKYIIVEIEGESGPDITGASIKWAAKRNPRASTNNVLKTTADGINLEDPVNGIFRIKLEPEDTKNLSGDYYHEAELTDVQGNVSTVMTGTITIIIDGI